VSFIKESEHFLASEIEKLSSLKDKKSKLLSVDELVRSRVFLRLHASVQKSLLAHLGNADILSLLRFMDPDEVTDVLQKISSLKVRDSLLSDLQEDVKHKVEFLLRFHPESAAGLMSLDYVVVSGNQSFSSVIKIVQKHERRTGKFPTIIVEVEGVILGELKGHVLALRGSREQVKKYLSKIHSVHFDESQDVVVDLFRQSRHDKVVVLDDNNFVLGVIYSDDVLRLLQDEPARSLYSFAGLEREETINESIRGKVKFRYRWLIVSLIAAFFVAFTITPFEHTIERMVLLAVYLPVVAMMGGNAATQTLAVVIRGLTLNQITASNAKKIIFKEVVAGVLNGLIVGVLVGIIAGLFNSNFMFGVVIGLAMIFNLFIAGFFGSLIPLVIKRLGSDPAPSAIMFIITLTDVFGFASFLGLAALLL
jgi:magnesium transporter